jgi:membrane-associated phospholipid phosphatase
MGEWLESLVPWGTEIIVWVQSFSNEWLDALFKFFTALGYEEFYLLALPLIYWCIHKQIGIALGYLSMFSAWANSVVKYTFKIPRPADPRLRIPLPETSPSFASGHAQNAVTNWGYLAYRFRNRIFWVVSIVVIVGISLSRIVLGVHFPQDVIGGALIGLILVMIYAWAAPAVSQWVMRQEIAAQLVLVIVVPLTLLFLHPADTEGLYPAVGSVAPMSALLGLGVGLIMERIWVRFRVEGRWRQRGLRFLVGLIVVGIVYAGPKLLLPEMEPVLATGVRFVRYTLLGWIVAFLCPWLFVRLRLAERTEDSFSKT